MLKKIIAIKLIVLGFLVSSTYAYSGAEKETVWSFGYGSSEIESESGSAYAMDMRTHWKAWNNIGLGIGIGFDQLDTDIKDNKGKSVGLTEAYLEVVAKYDFNQHFDINGALSYNTGVLGDWADGNAMGYEIGAKYRLLGHNSNWSFGIVHKVVNYSDMDVVGGATIDIDTTRTMIYIGKSYF